MHILKMSIRKLEMCHFNENAHVLRQEKMDVFRLGELSSWAYSFCHVLWSAPLDALGRRWLILFFIQKRRARKHAKRGVGWQMEGRRRVRYSYWQASAFLRLYPLFSHCPDPGLQSFYFTCLYFCSLAFKNFKWHFQNIHFIYLLGCTKS